MKKIKKITKGLLKNKFLILVLIIFACEVFLRFYEIEQRNPFGYDQVDNAWAAKNIIVNHWYPLVGMVAKANSGIYIGPAYYYLISIFYFFTKLNPIASGLFAGVTSIFTFWVLYFVTKKIFNNQVTIIALIINTFCLNAIIFDRIQWPVNLIPPVSLLIFYFLYKVILGEARYMIPLALATGFMFNVHFTAIFFPIIILLCLPFFPRRLETLKYAAISIPLFFVWIIPNAIYMVINKTSSGNISYVNTYYHGFHLKRVMQIVGDAFVQFDPYVLFDWLKKIKLIFPIVFLIVYFKKNSSDDKFKFLYLIILWFVVPWFIFAIYSGEISDYYFAANRFIVLLILSYLICSVWLIKNRVAKAVVTIFLFVYIMYNLFNFFPYKDVGLLERGKNVNEGRRIEFQVGVPESYLYYYLMKQKGVNVY